MHQKKYQNIIEQVKALEAIGDEAAVTVLITGIDETTNWLLEPGSKAVCALAC